VHFLASYQIYTLLLWRQHSSTTAWFKVTAPTYGLQLRVSE